MDETDTAVDITMEVQSQNSPAVCHLLSTSSLSGTCNLATEHQQQLLSDLNWLETLEDRSDLWQSAQTTNEIQQSTWDV